MKKYIFLFLIPGFLSCTSTSFVFENPRQTGVDFSHGKWLINELNVPSYLTQKLTERAKKDFSENIGDSVNYAPDVKGLLLPQKEIALNPDKATLIRLYKGTGYDYFINIKAREIKNDFSSIDLTNHHQKKDNYNFNKSSATIEIYDLKNALIIYSQTVIASVKQSNDNSDVNISRGQYLMILGAYNRLMQDINKKSIVR